MNTFSTGRACVVAIGLSVAFVLSVCAHVFCWLSLYEGMRSARETAGGVSQLMLFGASVAAGWLAGCIGVAVAHIVYWRSRHWTGRMSIVLVAEVALLLILEGMTIKLSALEAVILVGASALLVAGAGYAPYKHSHPPEPGAR